MIEAGTRFGKLITTGKVKRIRENSGKLFNYYECICECGTSKYYRGTGLTYGQKNSCGCGRYEKEKHTKHNLSNTRLYRIWSAMRTRCNKKYDYHYGYYGGRGISVCKEWDNTNDGFENFYKWSIENGYSEDLTIDRIDVNGNYEPGNCRWVAREMQQNNRRCVVKYEYKGSLYSMTQLSRLFNVCSNTFNYHLKRYGLEETIRYFSTKGNMKQCLL